jgi:hypothetical protein
MTCVNLKEQFGSRYRIAYDPAAVLERGGKSNPWYYVIPCKFGEIHPFGGEMLAFHCRGSKMRGIIKREFPDFEIESWTDDEEAIFIFPADRLPELAKIIKPRRRRQVSGSERQRLSEMGSKSRFSTAINAGTSVRNETLAGGRT